MTQATASRSRAGIAMRDGVQLVADVTTPGPGRFPALVTRTPYDRTSIDEPGGARWVVVNQDCRGRGESAGTALLFHQENSDGADTVDWCRAQPWSDGRVVLRGVSYEATAALLTACESPVSALALELGCGDVRDGWMYEHGAFGQHAAQGWAYGLAMGASGRSDAEKQQLAERLGGFDELLARPVDACLVEEATPDYVQWLQFDDETFWEPLRAERRVPDVPAFHVVGWFDPFCESGLRTYAAMAALRSPQRLVVGPWVHMDRYGRTAGEVDFGAAATGGEAKTCMLDWLADAIDGRAVTTGARVFDTGLGRWAELPRWPPVAEHAGVQLAEATVGGAPAEPQIALRYDPTDPVPTLGGRAMGDPASPGAFDQAPVEARTDVALLTSERLRVDTKIGGLVSLDVALGVADASVDVVAYLCDVDPSGRSRNVVGSATRLPAAHGGTARRRLELGSCLHTFRAGHRLRVRVAASDFPRISLNPNHPTTLTIDMTTPPELQVPVLAETER